MEHPKIINHDPLAIGNDREGYQDECKKDCDALSPIWQRQ